ncbi:nucleotidyltransferase domain-containing protein [Iodobacter fluviatilis]|uniref:Polymerase nucleotidyl transferase domain-containing protein n=1 Tax=Iodobacter fluviatilis TaxID=537 RepID=A0A7G3GC86_9NEIS|nr:nucleotidyltransferase domain-containing protein [Iodobacter fluviatilis]QBC44769.1 hypothetical protein C1H71_15335 [Iodobacter fluviatilis]
MPIELCRQPSSYFLSASENMMPKEKNVELNSQVSIDAIDMQSEKADCGVKPLSVILIGVSHLVEKVNGSLLMAKEGIQVVNGDRLLIDTANTVHSRRGPNHDIYDQVDKRSRPDYIWFHVLELNGNDITESDLYVRQETFITDDHEVLNASNIELSNEHRFYPLKVDKYDYPTLLTHQKCAPGALKTIKDIITAVEVREENINVKYEIEKFCSELSTHLGGTFVSFLYGSYATGSQKEGSDIDVMFSCDNQTYIVYQDKLVPLLTDFLKVLHDKVGARVDDEVPAEAKHLICAQEMMEAANGRIYYPQGDTGKPNIHTLSYFLDKEVVLDGMKKSESGRFGADFLASKYLKLRLIFNILTTPNEIASNNSDVVLDIKNNVRDSLIKLSGDLLAMRPDEDQFGVGHLLQDGHGNAGEMYLGYKFDRVGVAEKLKQLIYNFN